MFKLNVKPAACAFAIVTTAALARPAHANKAMYDWIKASFDHSVAVSAGSDFNITLGTETPITSDVTSLNFTLTYNPQVVTLQGFVVNAHTSPFDFSDTSGASSGAVDDTVTFSLRLNPDDTWPNALSDLTDLTFHGINRNDSVSADIALLAVSGSDAFNNPITIPLQDPADAQRILITPNATPEPASLALLSLAALPLLLKKRRE